MSLFALAGLGLAGCSEQSVEPDDVIRGVNYVGMSVSDLNGAATFYESANLVPVDDEPAFGVGVLEGWGLSSEVSVESRMLRSSNAQIRLMEFSGDMGDVANIPNLPVYGPGIAHVCYQVAKETGAYEKFLAAGAEPIGDPEMVRLSDRNPVEYAYARDLDGSVFEVEHVDVAALELPEPPKSQYRIRHVSLATPDMDRAIDFYSAFLGGQEPRRVGRFWNLSGEKLDKVSGETGSEIEMAWFQIRNLELELVQYHSHPTNTDSAPRPVNALGYNMIMFDVSDITAARQRLIDAGGTVVGAPVAIDGGKTLFGRDPDGNLLGLQQVSAASVVSSQNFANNGL